MGLSHREQHQLHRIEHDLLQSEPELATALRVFGLLSAMEAMPAWEQVPARLDRIRQAGALAAKAIILVVMGIGLLLNAIHALLLAAVQPISVYRR
jgi:hypothetical protein